MSIRNFDALFQPKVIALLGASNRPQTVGSVLASNLFGAGFAGPILAVNPHETAVHSTLNYQSVGELPLTPDLAVIATPPSSVPSLIAELGARGCRAAIVVTAGFAEGDRAAGAALQAAMLAAARPSLLRIVGPNCLGFMSPAGGINASFAHRQAPRGDIALVTQSGAVATTLLDWAAARGAGFSHVVSLGDMADVDFGDLLDYLALDRTTRAILLYVESISHARKFMSAARIAARIKPVVVIKAGRSAAGALAALSHTGALAGSDLVYDAAFRRAGLLRVKDFREAFEALATLALGIPVAGDRLAIVTNGGGLGVMAVDELVERGGRLASLSAGSIARLDAVLPPTWSHGNPADIVGDADGERYEKVLAAIAGSNDADAILVMNSPTAVADSQESGERVAVAIGARPAMPFFTCWMGEGRSRAARDLFAAKRIPTYETPEDAARAFMHLVEYRRNQDELLETPPVAAKTMRPDVAAVRAVLSGALKDGRTVLSALETKAILAAYAVPVLASRSARDPAEAAAVATEMGGPVALKIRSADITHKSDVGGVRLNLSPNEVEAAAHEMERAVRAAAPGARLAGFSLEQMVRSDGHELLLGIGEDKSFGPVVLFGHGGTAAEAIGDRALALPPLNAALAAHLIARTKVARLLQGYRNRPRAALEAIADVLVKLSQIATDIPEIVELDINPLIADEHSVIAVDARAVIRAASATDNDRLAIRPYPTGLTHGASTSDGAALTIRAIQPQDEPALAAMVLSSTMDDIRLRFFAPLKEFPHKLAARFSQIDYDREMALVATPAGAANEILGVARLAADPDNVRAEYAVMVRSDMKGHGIGYRLMTDLLDYARRRGIQTVFGEILQENVAMLQMARELGFTIDAHGDPGVVTVSVDLRPPIPAA